MEKFKTVHQNKSELEQFYIFEASYGNGKKLSEQELTELRDKFNRSMQEIKLVEAINSLPKYYQGFNGEMQYDNPNGEYIKLEDVLALFSAKNTVK